MKNCESVREKMLSGEDSGEIRSHLEGCAECSRMLSLWKSVKDTGKSSSANVSVQLDFNIMSKASSVARRHRNASFVKKFLWIPAAAVLFVSAGVVIYSMSLPETQVVSPVAKNRPAKLNLMNWDSLDTEILVLSAELESAGSSIDLSLPDSESYLDSTNAVPSAILDSSLRNKRFISAI